jgi:hypothetical protein
MTSALREATFYKRREDRPLEVEQMAEFFSEHGWTLWEEWQEPWYDEEESEYYEGWWGYHLVYEEKFGEQLHSWHMFPIHPTPYREAWQASLELARMGWEQYREQRGL